MTPPATIASSQPASEVFNKDEVNYLESTFTYAIQACMSAHQSAQLHPGFEG